MQYLHKNVSVDQFSKPDAHFIHFETQTLDSNQTTMNLKQFGFKLHLLHNSSLEPVTFTIGVASSLLPDFIPPVNTVLVSALYYIKTTSELLQPVIIEIEHCVGLSADWEDNTKLTFAKVHMDVGSKLPYQYVFSKLSGGRFDRKSWGTITLSTFSTVAVLAEDKHSSIDYLAHLLSSRRKGGSGTYQVALVASLSLNAYKEVLY